MRSNSIRGVSQYYTIVVAMRVCFRSHSMLAHMRLPTLNGYIVINGNSHCGWHWTKGNTQTTVLLTSKSVCFARTCPTVQPSAYCILVFDSCVFLSARATSVGCPADQTGVQSRQLRKFEHRSYIEVDGRWRRFALPSIYRAPTDECT